MSDSKTQAINDCVRFIIYNAGTLKSISKNTFKEKVLKKHGVRLEGIINEINQELEEVCSLYVCI